MKNIVLSNERTIQIKAIQQNVENILGVQRETLDIIFEDSSISYEDLKEILYSQSELFNKIIYFSDEEKNSVPPIVLYDYNIPLGIITTAEGLSIKLAQKTIIEKLQEKIVDLEARLTKLEEKGEILLWQKNFKEALFLDLPH